MHLFLELTREPMAQQLDREAQRSRALAGEDLVRRCRAGLLKDHGHVADLPPPDPDIPANGEPPYRKTQALNGRFSIR